MLMPHIAGSLRTPGSSRSGCPSCWAKKQPGRRATATRQAVDTFQLTQTIQNLERTVEDLRIELADRTDDLNAARTATAP